SVISDMPYRSLKDRCSGHTVNEKLTPLPVSAEGLACERFVFPGTDELRCRAGPCAASQGALRPGGRRVDRGSIARADVGAWRSFRRRDRASASGATEKS